MARRMSRAEADAAVRELRGLIDARGVFGACKILDVSDRELGDMQWPGTDERLLAKVRRKLQERRK